MESGAIFITTAVLVTLWVAPAYGGNLDYKVVFMADTGFYLCRIYRGNTNHEPIEGDGVVPASNCRYTVSKNSDGTYSFLADNNLYIGRVYRDSVFALEAYYWYLDASTKFNVINHGSAKISLQSSYSLSYVRRVNRRGGYNPVEVSGNSAEDVLAQFTVEYLELDGKSYERACFDVQELL